MLGLVMHAGFAPPAHDEHTGDAVHPVVHQGGHGVDDVAQAAVLQIHHRHAPRCQVIACRQAHGVALVGGDHMLRADAKAIHHIAAQGLEQRIGHAGEEIKLVKKVKLHQNSSGISVRISLIGMHMASSASLAR